jgi:hypothetical protein
MPPCHANQESAMNESKRDIPGWIKKVRRGGWEDDYDFDNNTFRRNVSSDEKWLLENFTDIPYELPAFMHVIVPRQGNLLFDFFIREGVPLGYWPYMPNCGLVDTYYSADLSLPGDPPVPFSDWSLTGSQLKSNIHSGQDDSLDGTGPRDIGWFIPSYVDVELMKERVSSRCFSGLDDGVSVRSNYIEMLDCLEYTGICGTFTHSLRVKTGVMLFVFSKRYE